MKNNQLMTLTILLCTIVLQGCGGSETSSYNQDIPSTTVSTTEEPAISEPSTAQEINLLDLTLYGSGDRARQPPVAYGEGRFLVATCRAVGDVQAVFSGVLLSESGEVLKQFDFNAPFHTHAVYANSCNDLDFALSFHDGQFLVAYRHASFYSNPDNPASSRVGVDLIVHRIDGDGNFLDDEGISLSSQYSTSDKVDIAYDGENYFIVFNTYDDVRYPDNPARIKGVIFSQGGDVLRNFDFPAHSVSFPRAVWDGSQYIISWIEYGRHSGNILAIKVSKSGEVLTNSPILIKDTESAITGFDLDVDNSGNVIVTWGHSVNSIATNIFSRYFVMPMPELYFGVTPAREQTLWASSLWRSNGKIVVRPLDSGFDIYYFDIAEGLVVRHYDSQLNQLGAMLRQDFSSYYTGPWHSNDVSNFNIAFGETKKLFAFSEWDRRNSLTGHLLDLD